jgi:hypothetical protein
MVYHIDSGPPGLALADAYVETISKYPIQLIVAAVCDWHSILK